MRSETERPSADADRRSSAARRREGWLAAGDGVGALLASACCVLPFALFSLGIGGAWIGQLTALAPYQAWFWAAGALLVAGGLVSVRRRGRACRLDAACAASPVQRIAHAVLWLAALLLAVSALWPFIVPVLLGQEVVR